MRNDALRRWLIKFRHGLCCTWLVLGVQPRIPPRGREGAMTMATKRKPTAPTTEAIDRFCAACDALFACVEERRALRQ